MPSLAERVATPLTLARHHDRADTLEASLILMEARVDSATASLVDKRPGLEHGSWDKAEISGSVRLRDPVSRQLSARPTSIQTPASTAASPLGSPSSRDRPREPRLS